MGPSEILAELKVQAGSAPDFASYSPTSRLHLEWLGKTHSLIALLNKMDAIKFGMAADNLPSELWRDNHVATIMTLLHQSIAQLERKVPHQPEQVFGPGAVYDFMKGLRAVMSSACSSLLIVDPYLDDAIFDTYLSHVSKSVDVRLLTMKHTTSLASGLYKFNSQHGMAVAIRRSSSLHDRLVFVDGSSCWLLGQSIKDAASVKPTYLAPLDADFVLPKLSAYEQIWQAATPIV